MKLNFMRASSTVPASDHLYDDNVVLMDVVEATTAATNEDIEQWRQLRMVNNQY